MPVAQRIFQRFFDQRTARQVTSRFVWAMSRDDAARTLGLDPRKFPTDADVVERYRAKIKDVMRSSPNAAQTQEEFKDLNIAKDTLLGQFDRKRPGDGPNAPETRAQRPDFKQDDFRQDDWQDDSRRTKKEPEEPAPIPEGEPFTAALQGLGNVDWKILSNGYWGYDVVVETEGPPRKVYFAYTADFILIGRTHSHYVFAKLSKKTNSRHGSREHTNEVARWQTLKIERPTTTDLLKLAPKVIAGLREKAHGRAKFSVLEGTLTETMLDYSRKTLSLADAIIGSGILGDDSPVGGIKGRKVQIELEPIYNRDKHKVLKDNKSREWHLGYDWYLYINGKKSELNEREVEGLEKHYILSAVFSYNYENGKKNLTRLRGGTMKFSPKDALEQLVKALDPGPSRDAVAKAAEAFA